MNHLHITRLNEKTLRIVGRGFVETDYGFRQKKGITQLIDGTSGNGYSGYPNVGVGASLVGLRKYGWKKTDTIVRAFSLLFNVSQPNAPHPADKVALAIDRGEWALPAVGETRPFHFDGKICGY